MSLLSFHKSLSFFNSRRIAAFGGAAPTDCFWRRAARRSAGFGGAVALSRSPR